MYMYLTRSLFFFLFLFLFLLFLFLIFVFCILSGESFVLLHKKTLALSLHFYCLSSFVVVILFLICVHVVPVLLRIILPS